MGVEDDFLAAHAASDWATAVSLIDRHWTTLVFDARTARAVFHTIGSAPEEELARAPRVVLMGESVGRVPRGSSPVALASGPGQVDRAMRTGTARELLEIAITAMIARRATGLPHEAVEIARSSRRLLRAASLTRYSPAADLAAYWHLQAGQAALHAGDLDQAQVDLEHAWRFCDEDVTGYVAASTAPFLALLATLRGDDDAAVRWHAEVDALAPSGRDLIEWDTMERPRLVARLLDAADRGDDRSGADLTELLLPQLPFDEIWPLTVYAVTRHLVDRGDLAGARHQIEATSELHPSAPATGTVHEAFVALARAEIALAAGQDAALDRLLQGTGSHLVPAWASVYAVHLELLRGDLDAARRRAVIAGGQSQERARREADLLQVALGLAPATPGPLHPALRRTATQLPAALADVVRAAYGDDVPASRPGRAAPTAPTVRLTAAETRVVDALHAGGSLPEVAERLFISRNTLKTQLRGLYAKLGVSSREEAVAVAGRLGLTSDDGPV